ncbi:hypothetical protein [Nocardia crassostreae]|uniref:hypothetical protein n=1 Tax=Nocardia crassostreae TaxID=53428 RepID=UPI000A6C3353|nr:hypothetical protein [Nocardia crassostreae]
MGKRQPVDQVSPRRRRIGSLAIAGALPLAAVFSTAGTASAEPATTEPAVAEPAVTEPAATEGAPSMVIVDSPFGPLTLPVPPDVAEGVRTYLDTVPIAAEAEAGAEADAALGEAPVAEIAPVVRVDRNSSTGVRDIPQGPLAAVDVQALRMPDPAAARDFAPIAAPPGKLRFGDTQVDIPPWLTPEQADQVNAVAAGTEAELASNLDAAGFEPSRSDRIAAQTVGTAAVGAAVGVGVAAPVEAFAVVMGGFVGAMAGTPFAPAGWVFGPAVGATAAFTLIAVPAATVGAGIGAAVGAANGFLAPATEPAPVADPVIEVDAAAEIVEAATIE